MDNNFVIGVDFGTDSVRAIVVDASNGQLVGEEVSVYARWMQGKYCEPDKTQFRQHPRDYVEGLEACVRGALKKSGKTVEKSVKGIAVDATGSTPSPVNRKGTPLAMLPGFEENPNAMFHLWKDHTAVAEAEEFNRVADGWDGEDYTKFQGKYSSEWFLGQNAAYLSSRSRRQTSGLFVGRALRLDSRSFSRYSSPKSIVESNTTQILQSPK